MRYTYHGIMVESGIALDSAVFHKTEPEQAEKKPTAEKPAQKKPQAKKRK